MQSLIDYFGYFTTNRFVTNRNATVQSESTYCFPSDCDTCVLCADDAPAEAGGDNPANDDDDADVEFEVASSSDDDDIVDDDVDDDDDDDVLFELSDVSNGPWYS